MNDTTGLRGIEMADEEVDEFLTDQGYGTFSVASEGHVYSVPISIGYDGDQVFMYLITFGDVSKKVDYLYDTQEASVLAMDIIDRFDWRSVVVSGPCSEISEDMKEYHQDVIEENAWHPSLFPPTEPMTEVTRIVLDPTTKTGRKGPKHQDT